VPLNTAAESEEEFVIATSAAMRSKSDQSSGLAIRPERFNSIDELEIVVVSSILTLKVDPSQDCTCTVENAGEINESRKVIVSKAKVRPIISKSLLGTFILYIVSVLPGINQSDPDLEDTYTSQSLF
jgi:hypothetical protein